MSYLVFVVLVMPFIIGSGSHVRLGTEQGRARGLRTHGRCGARPASRSGDSAIAVERRRFARVRVV